MSWFEEHLFVTLGILFLVAIIIMIYLENPRNGPKL